MKLPWLIAILTLGVLAICVLAFWFLVPGEQRNLAELQSPSGDWRIVVTGTQLWTGSIEITADVYTQDGRRISRGVIDQQSDWPIAQYTYGGGVNGSLIDDTKARLGNLMNATILYRDDYFPTERFEVSGTIAGQPVRFRSGKVDDLGFEFFQGWDGQREDFTVSIIDFPQQLTDGAVFEINDASPRVPLVRVSANWIDPQTGQSWGGSLKHAQLTLQVDRVTDQLVTGTVRLTGKEPQVDLNGHFRLPRK